MITTTNTRIVVEQRHEIRQNKKENEHLFIVINFCFVF